MSYRSEFPSYDGEFVVLDGFKDTSYGNDTCPSCSKVLPNGNTITVYQDYENPENRENPNGDRYTVLITDEAGNEISCTQEGDCLIDVIIQVNGYVEEVEQFGNAEWISVKKEE